MEKVSIISPAYNCLDSFANAFNSVLNQKYKNIEWIIIDDCSTDGSYDYIKSKIDGYCFIKLLKTKENGGAAVARNLGIKEAKGRYIAFLDMDDMWKPAKIEKQVKFMNENDYAFTYSDYDVLFSDGNIKTFSPKKNITHFKNLLVTCDIGCLTVMLDVQKLGKQYFPIDASKREDHAMWLDITMKGFTAHKLHESLAIYRLSEGSVSSNKKAMFRCQYLMYRRHLKFNFFKALWYTLLVSFNKVFKKY